jgi:enoyl-CoA hydratase/carnithine racemase
VLTLSRPEKLNAITWEMRERVFDHFREIDSDEDIQVVVIRSEGEQVSPGGDIPGLMEVEAHQFVDLGTT